MYRRGRSVGCPDVAAEEALVPDPDHRGGLFPALLKHGGTSAA